MFRSPVSQLPAPADSAAFTPSLFFSLTSFESCVLSFRFFLFFSRRERLYSYFAPHLFPLGRCAPHWSFACLTLKSSYYKAFLLSLDLTFCLHDCIRGLILCADRPPLSSPFFLPQDPLFFQAFLHPHSASFFPTVYLRSLRTRFVPFRCLAFAPSRLSFYPPSVPES